MALFSRHFFSPQQRIYYGGMLLGVLVLMLLFLPPDLFAQVGLIASGVILLTAFLLNLEWGVYAMAAISFLRGWEIILSKYYTMKNVAYLSSLNAPLIDFITVVLTGCVVIALVLGLHKFKVKNFRYLAIPIALYGLFIIIATLSARQAFDSNFALSARYLARFMIFVFVGYVLVPNLVVRERPVLDRVLKIWFWVGTGVALFGLSSLLVVAQKGWLRVVPYGIGSFAPLGYNHNLIAEVLVAIIPVAAYFAWRAYRNGERDKGHVYITGLSLMFVTTLMTLSRAGWLAIFLELFFVVVLFRSEARAALRRRPELTLVCLAGVAALLLYMGLFLGSKIVASSTTNRLATTEIVAHYATRSPLLGYGPGMYRLVLGNTKAYVMDFGEPLEAHGFIQKILLEVGFVGLGLFLAFFGYIMAKLWQRFRQKREDGLLYIMFLCMIGGELVFQLFNTSYFNSVLWLPVGMALVAIGMRE